VKMISAGEKEERRLKVSRMNINTVSNETAGAGEDQPYRLQ